MALLCKCLDTEAFCAQARRLCRRPLALDCRSALTLIVTDAIDVFRSIPHAYHATLVPFSVLSATDQSFAVSILNM